MSSGASTLTDAYLEHLTARDLSLLVPSDYGDRDLARAGALFRSGRGLLEEALASSTVFDTVFIHSDAGDPILNAFPFLVFALCIHRAVAELRSASYVPEWLGPGRRAPVFDVEQLREFVAEPWRRLFLIELLASYTTSPVDL